MKEEAQCIALCEWAGWKKSTAWHCQSEVWQKPNHILGDCLYDKLPDTNSLDVLHSFEMKLNDVQKRTYAMMLHEMTKAYDEFSRGMNYFVCINATAEQRRTALLKTLNLWREDSNKETK